MQATISPHYCSKLCNIVFSFGHIIVQYCACISPYHFLPNCAKMAWRVQDARMGEIAVRDEGVGGQPVDECVPRLSIEVIPKSTWVDAVDELRMREAENPRRSKGIRDREPSAGSVRFFPKSAALRCAAGLARASAREMPRVRTRWCTRWCTRRSS